MFQHKNYQEEKLHYRSFYETHTKEGSMLLSLSLFLIKIICVHNFSQAK